VVPHQLRSIGRIDCFGCQIGGRGADRAIANFPAPISEAVPPAVAAITVFMAMPTGPSRFRPEGNHSPYETGHEASTPYLAGPSLYYALANRIAYPASGAGIPIPEFLLRLQPSTLK